MKREMMCMVKPPTGLLCRRLLGPTKENRQEDVFIVRARVCFALGPAQAQNMTVRGKA